MFFYRGNYLLEQIVKLRNYAFLFSLFIEISKLLDCSSFVQKILQNRNDAIEQYCFIEEDNCKIGKLLEKFAFFSMNK